MVGVPMQRDEKLGTRNVLTDEEFAERERRAAQQEEQDNADFELENAASTPGGDVGGAVSPPPHWLERGEPQRQASLIVDPPNGRMPAFTQAAQERQAALREFRQSRGPADSYTDRSNYDRCITRGLAGSILPVIYNNGTQIFQSPGYVAIVNEMIHETRIVPLDGRPHVGFCDQDVARRLARPLRRRHARRRDDELHGPHGRRRQRRRPAAQRSAEDHGALHARRRRPHRLPDDGRRSADVDRAVDDAVPAEARRRATACSSTRATRATSRCSTS